ncbi:hypothetical protein ACS49_03775 [Bacillus cereus]|nr:hypothetical protein ACS49_03775 [Bacillus cereus]
MRAAVVPETNCVPAQGAAVQDDCVQLRPWQASRTGRRRVPGAATRVHELQLRFARAELLPRRARQNLQGTGDGRPRGIELFPHRVRWSRVP